MSLTLNARISGTNKINEALKLLAKNSPKELKRALTESALVIEGRAKSNITTNQTVDSGRLRASITSRIKGNEKKGFTGEVGTNVKYAPYIEFGTGKFATVGTGRSTPWVYFNRKLKRFVRTEGMVAKPFLIPAFKASRRDIIKFIRAAFKRLERSFKLRG